MAAKSKGFIDQKTGIEMAFVRGGSFFMGCTGKERKDKYGYPFSWLSDETPLHLVTLSDFYIGRYVVTQKQWFLVMESNPSSDNRDENLPVTDVSWDDIQWFLGRLNTLTGNAYRLPTEAEWEFAARGGTKSKGFKFAGSDNIDDVAWHGENFFHRGNSGGMTHPVGTKAPNELRLYDMSGNVREWVSDYYGKYGPLNVTDPKGSLLGTERVTRGGAFYGGGAACRVSCRCYGKPDHRSFYLGFRLALSK